VTDTDASHFTGTTESRDRNGWKYLTLVKSWFLEITFVGNMSLCQNTAMVPYFWPTLYNVHITCRPPVYKDLAQVVGL